MARRGLVWKPVRVVEGGPGEPDEPMWKGLVSRVVLLLMGLALLAGALKTWNWYSQTSAEHRASIEEVRLRNGGKPGERSVRDDRLERSERKYFGFVACGLGLAGVVFVLAAVMPTAFWYQFVGPT